MDPPRQPIHEVRRFGTQIHGHDPGGGSGYVKHSPRRAAEGEGGDWSGGQDHGASLTHWPFRRKARRCLISTAGIYSPGVCKTVETTTPATAEIQLPIEGMSCASCVNRIERYLRKTPGVAEANVNLATEVATVRYLPETAGLDEIAQAIEAAGYEIRHIPEAVGGGRASLLDEADAEAVVRAREQRTLGLIAAVSLTVAAITMLVMYCPTRPGRWNRPRGSSSVPQRPSSSWPGAVSTAPP